MTQDQGGTLDSLEKAKKKSLLIINSSFPIEMKDGSFIIKDGISSYAVGLAARLNNKYRITIVSPGSCPSFTYAGVRFFNWGGQSPAHNKAGNLEYWTKVMQYLFTRSFNFVLVHSAVTIFLAFISDILPARCLGVIHDTYPGKYKFYFNLGREAWLRKSKKLDLSFTDNSDGRETLIVKYKYDSRKVHWVGGGVDLGFYPFSTTKEDRLLFIGRFVRSKQVMELLRAFRPWLQDHKKAKLVLIGNGVLADALGNYLAKHRLAEQVEIFSDLTDKQKIAELRRAKVYVSLSQIEGFGLSLVEAMACGVVPVVSGITAHEFVFQGRKVGFLVKDSEDMIAKVNLLWKNEELRQEMAARGRSLVEDMWTWEKVAERFRKAISGLEEKELSLFVQKIKRPVKMGILKFSLQLIYFFLFRLSFLKSPSEGR